MIVLPPFFKMSHIAREGSKNYNKKKKALAMSNTSKALPVI